MTLKKKALENTGGKGENAGKRANNQLATSNLWSADAFNLFLSKILSFGKELRCLKSLVHYNSDDKILKWLPIFCPFPTVFSKTIFVRW